MATIVPSYRCHRYPADIIVQCVRLYFRFPLSHRGIEELMFERGIVVSYESIRRWCHKFSSVIAAERRQRRPQPKGRWHLDEVFIKMNGKTYYMWRAVAADGMVLDILVQERRNQAAAEALLRRLVDGYRDQSQVVVTDKLASYGPALNRVLHGTEHRKHKGLNNRAENSHQPTRHRERAMRRFKSPTQAQRFLEPLSLIREHFCPGRHHLSGRAYRAILLTPFATWRDVTGIAV